MTTFSKTQHMRASSMKPVVILFCFCCSLITDLEGQGFEYELYDVLIVSFVYVAGVPQVRIKAFLNWVGQ